jgi:predicted ATPase
MLSEITLSNFKCFKEETTFPLANINVFAGINGSGKSSVIQSLLLMRQSVDIDNYADQVYLNGNCVDLGTVESIKNIETSRELPIVIKFKGHIEDVKNMLLEVSYQFATEEIEKVNENISVNLNDRHLTLKEIRDVISHSPTQFSQPSVFSAAAN